jgi:hypothetical protein
MNPPASPDEPRNREPGGRSRVLFALGSVAALAVFVWGLSLLSAGCRKPPKSVDPDQGNSGPKGDPWEVAAKQLQKKTDVTACKSAINELNAGIANTEGVAKPAVLTPEAEAALAALVPLTPEDRDEVRGAGHAFTTHDPVYLAECLYLRDAARSLAVSGLAPDQAADLAFAWVCRQVTLSPWPAISSRGILSAAALPPTYILRRGSGSALERMYVFLALLQQIGLDGCLVGPPDAKEVLAYPIPLGPDRVPLPGGPTGPFWAAGVRVGSDVRLYDPWRSQPFPATLAQLKANPDAHKAWFDDKANASGVTAAEAKNAAVYLAVPVNALAPRMATLQEKLKDDVGVRLAVDAAALRASFPDPKPAYWNPPGDRFAYGRTARSFLPLEEGGSDRTERGTARPYDAYFLSQVPPLERGIPPELRENKTVVGDVKTRFGQAGQGIYRAAFLTPPTPREYLQRGQFQKADAELVEKKDAFGSALRRFQTEPDRERLIRAWGERATQLYKDLGVDPGAAAAIDDLWRSQAVTLLLERTVSEVGQAETAYLLALCKHEQAERAQARLDRAAGNGAEQLRKDAADAWAIAVGEWRGYLEQYAPTQDGVPGRVDHAKTLAARAEALAK